MDGFFDPFFAYIPIKMPFIQVFISLLFSFLHLKTVLVFYTVDDQEFWCWAKTIYFTNRAFKVIRIDNLRGRLPNYHFSENF